MVVGETGVGKTSLLYRWTMGEFLKVGATVGAAYMNRDVPLSGGGEPMLGMRRACKSCSSLVVRGKWTPATLLAHP